MAKLILLAAAAALLASTGGAASASAQSKQPTGASRPIDGSVQREETVEQLRARAARGERGAQFDLAVRLLQSDVAAEAAEGRRWFQEAADRGDAEAKNALAMAHMLGLGGPADVARGRHLMEEAAREGSGGANLSIADRYLAGAEGYPQDPRRAFEHVSAAAATEVREGRGSYAQWRLAMMHLEGTGTPRNAREAYRLVVQSSEAGGVRAMISRAVMLATGDGVDKDAPAARHWYQRAAESGEYGFEHGLRGLGAMLVVGEGGSVDLPRGIAYLRIAAAARDEAASPLLDAFADRVTPEVEREAQRVAREWMERHLPRN